MSEYKPGQVYKVLLPKKEMTEIRQFAAEMKRSGFQKDRVYGQMLMLGYERRDEIAKRMIKEAGK